MKAIDIIHNEHRALGAVLQAFRFVLDGLAKGAQNADFGLLQAMIDYITEVPDELHHPKEDEVLFVAIRACVPQAAALLDKLQHDHAQGLHGTRALRQALADYQAAGPAGYTRFAEVAGSYIDASWSHIKLEENELLPMARRLLEPADWAGIDAAFEANKDPWAGPTGKFRALFTRIVSLVPAPYGLGAPV